MGKKKVSAALLINIMYAIFTYLFLHMLKLTKKGYLKIGPIKDYNPIWVRVLVDELEKSRKVQLKHKEIRFW